MVVHSQIFQKHHIIAAYIFGSYAKGTQRTQSDLDIGVIVQNRESVDARQLINELIQETKKEVDLSVVDLTHSSPLLMYEIVQGDLIYEKNHDDRVSTVAQILSRSSDERFRIGKIVSELNK